MSRNTFTNEWPKLVKELFRFTIILNETKIHVFSDKANTTWLQHYIRKSEGNIFDETWHCNDNTLIRITPNKSCSVCSKTTRTLRQIVSVIFIQNYFRLSRISNREPQIKQNC
ncbi:hypothetical protein QQG55_16965 [Brugia pahangi]